LYFKQPAGTSRGVYHTRNVWYILIKSVNDNTHIGIGECAPLPDLSCDAFPDYEYILGNFCRNLERNQYLDMESLKPYPSILFGLETAIRHYEASDPILWDSGFTKGEIGIPINGLIWMGDYEKMLSQIEKKMAAGFRCIKLKIGAINFEEEIALIKHIRKHYSASEIELRMDANGAFSAEDAPYKLHQLAALQLHSIEQPIRAGQWEEMRKLTSVTPLPVALDEELIGINKLEDKQQLLDVICPQYIILKPSLHGGISGCNEWINEAEKRNIQWWITSALESNIGLNAIAQWCATFNNPLPQGLGTGQLFVDNISMPLSIHKDCLWYHRDLSDFLTQWNDKSSVVTVQTSGSTGTPKEMKVRKNKMEQSARLTCSFLGLKKNDKALLCMPVSYIAGKMMVVRALVENLDLYIQKPDSHPFANLETTMDFVALTPMQVFNSLQIPEETEKLKQVRTVIIGGGVIDKEIEKKLRDFPNNIYSTYGMTETLSHIALRKLNGKDSSEYYVPFPSVKLSFSEKGTLIIDAPLVSDDVLYTNDIVELLPDERFKVLGRIDNVINSGGIKIQIEVLEQKLSPFLKSGYAITSAPDNKFGEVVVLLSENSIERNELTQYLSGYEIPRYIFHISKVPLTSSNKIDRASCKKLAVQLMKSIPN
jgi:Acyl-CoA synthetases (AMP-forming)/AMP-acid ligases II